MLSKHDGKSIESFEESDGFWLCIIGGPLWLLSREWFIVEPEWRQGDQSGTRKWWLSQDGEPRPVQRCILKVEPIGISKGWGVEADGKRESRAPLSG